MTRPPSSAGWRQGFDAAKGLMERFCARVAADLHDHSERAKAEGRDHDMYRANTAWHNVTGIIDYIRTLPPPPSQEGASEGEGSPAEDSGPV